MVATLASTIHVLESWESWAETQQSTWCARPAELAAAWQHNNIALYKAKKAH